MFDGEPVETLYLPGEEDRIVGVSGYADRPRRVRKDKPKVSAFTSADIPKILALSPDLVLTFSDLQTDIAAELIRAGVAAMACNQRDIAGILAMNRMTQQHFAKIVQSTSVNADVYLCGPEGLKALVTNCWEDVGMSGKVHSERFGFRGAHGVRDLFYIGRMVLEKARTIVEKARIAKHAPSGS